MTWKGWLAVVLMYLIVAVVLAWAAVMWPDPLSRYLAPFWTTAVAAYTVYLLTSFRHIVRSTRLLLTALDEQLNENRETVEYIQAEAYFDGQSVGVPGRRPYFSAWDLYTAAPASHYVSDAIVSTALGLRQRFKCLTDCLDELDAATEETRREGRQTHDYRGHVGFIHTLSRDTTAVLNSMASLVDRERATLMRRVVPAQFLPLIAALALLVLVLSAPALSEALPVLSSLKASSGLP